MKTANLPLSVLESLESRLAPAGLVTLNLSSAGVLTVTGDGLDNHFAITGSADQWTITSLDSSSPTSFKLNGGPEVSSLSFDAPLSINAVLGAGNDRLVLDGSSVPLDQNFIPRTLNINTGDGDDTLDFTSTSIGNTATVVMGNGDDLFTGGGDLYFAKGLSVNLGKGANTFDVNADSLLSNGNIVATSGGLANELQEFVLKTGVGQINGSLLLKTTTASPTLFEIGDSLTDSLSVTKAMTLQSAAGQDEVILRGDVTVGGLLALRLGNGNNNVITTNLDHLSSTGLTYTGGTGSDDFFIEAREVIINGNFSFAAGAGTNILEVATTEYFGVTKALTYTGGAGYDELVLAGPEVYVFGQVSMAASHGQNLFAVDATQADLGLVRFTAGTGDDIVDIGQPDGNSSLIDIYGAVTISTGGGQADIQIIDSDIRGNLSITTAVGRNAAEANLLDSVLLLDSDFRGNVLVSMTGHANSYVEVRDGIFDRNVTVNTGNGNDEVRFDTDTEVSSIYSWFDGYVRINLGAGDDEFYAGSNPTVDTVGNDFNWYVDVYGGTGYDTAYFMSTADYNNGFNGPLPWASSVEDLA